MKKFSSGMPLVVSFPRSVAFAALLVLAACGGGGSSNLTDPIGGNPPPVTPPPVTPPPVTPPPVTPPTGTLVISPTTCVVTTAGTGICPQPVTLTSTVQNGTGVAAIRLPDGSTVPPGTNVPVNTPPTLGKIEYQLVDGTVLARATITVSCDSNLTEKDGKCIAPPKVLTGYDIIIAMDTFKVGMPVRISGESCATAKVEEAVNKTSFPERPEWNFALFSAHVLEPVTSLGWINVAQQVVADSNKLRTFLYNPVSNELYDDDGSQGTTPSLYPLDPAWKRVSVADHPDPAIGNWAQTEKILVYIKRVEETLYCEDVIGGVRSGKPVVLPVTNEYGGFAGFWRFKN